MWEETCSKRHVVWRADRRCDLVALLLKPPDGQAGDVVPDETLRLRVWGGDAALGRAQLNTLIHRLRKTLTRGWGSTVRRSWRGLVAAVRRGSFSHPMPRST